MLSLDRAHKYHLEHLNQFNAEVIAEFCKLAVQSLLAGDLSQNEKLYAKAASRLQSDTEIVNQSIEALVALFKLAARRNLSKLQDSLVLTQLSQTHVDIIAESYVEVHHVIERHVKEILPTPLSYRSLEWRLAAVIATRSLRGLMDPVLTLQFQLIDCNGYPRKVMLECSIDNLRKLRDVVEEALLMAKSRRVRKVTRMLT
ncbi:COMM domain-containing protein 2 [Galendromus occidentalis]|uniref:COMM domain-containing protein 2 n=1 Tax=Galendromus occidentalis TaxID=34638 RepID=A0AAJ6QT45_9ACAR|nr:COMM domain-containing protein 2 [Galendromus occidentalis]